MKVTVDRAEEEASSGRKARQRIAFSAPRKPRVSRSYGRFVGIMRILLPTVATALIIVVALWPQLSDQQRRYSITPAKVDAKATETVTMVNGVYTGVDEKQRPFTLTADSVQLASAGWTKVDMVSPKADILMLDGSWIAVTAKAGKYNRDEKILKLDGAVNLFHDSGYEFRTDAATIDMKAGDARGSKPVEGQGPFGNLKAEGFVIHNRGERIEFTGRSTIVLHPGQTPGR
jgi:lipopolysaccharide export system protein LptC